MGTETTGPLVSIYGAYSFEFEGYASVTALDAIAIGDSELNGTAFLGDVAVLAVLRLRRISTDVSVGQVSHLAVLWGGGTIDVTSRGIVTYGSGVNQAQAAFLGVTIHLNGGTTAVALDTSVSPNLLFTKALTPLALDTAQGVAGAGGFGGNAFNPSGGSYVGTSLVP